VGQPALAVFQPVVDIPFVMTPRHRYGRSDAPIGDGEGRTPTGFSTRLLDSLEKLKWAYLWRWMNDRICVQRAICAPPGTVFKVLVRLAGNVSVDGSGMLMWADGDPVSAVDGTFPVISEINLRASLGILARNVAPGLGRPGARED